MNNSYRLKNNTGCSFYIQ